MEARASLLGEDTVDWSLLYRGVPGLAPGSIFGLDVIVFIKKQVKKHF